MVQDESAKAAFGQIDLDGNGRVLAADPGTAALLGCPGQDLTGRDFFVDVAPAMRVPAFMDRFLDGVRRGALDDRFGFILGAETGAIELEVRLADGAEPGRYTIALSVRRLLEPSRQREATLAVDQRSRAEAVDPTICEQEPIHVPGTIQSQGALLAIGTDTLTIAVASENLAEIIGLPIEAVLGRPLGDLFPARMVERLTLELSRAEARSSLRFVETLGSPPRPLAVVVHRRDERVLIEFEVSPAHPADYGVPSHSDVKMVVRALREAQDLSALARSAADHVRRMSGFERVLVYRFDRDWNGEAVGESIVPDWDERLIGLHFPSSDIPRQARELYTVAPSRFVVDRDATPVPLVASDNRPVDLSGAVFRSLSPIHLEYQRNLGVNGSMSVALMVGGTLWGLLIGHHRRPHYVAPDTRDAIGLLADAMALRIHDLETAALTTPQLAHLRTEQALLEAMAAGEDFVTAVTGDHPRLTDLFGATGAAVVTDDVAATVGDTPPEADILALADVARGAAPPGAWHFATSHLEALVPEAARYRADASGLLAAFIDPERRALLLWFRPEIVSTVVWSGDPNKTVMADVSRSAILPRRSFERWVEEKRGRSLPWAEWEIDIARALSRAVSGVALRQSRRIREMSATQDELLRALAQKDVLLAEKDLLTREIDHRVKNSLQIVSAFVSMQARHLRDPVAKQAFEETYGRVMSIARVHDSLYQADDLQQVDLGQTIENLCRDLSQVGGARRDLKLALETGLMVPYRKAVALCLIATELVTNAWKYAYPDQQPGIVEVTIDRHEEAGVKLRVCDQGAGLPEDWDTRPRRGLGMQLIRAMLNQINATLQVETSKGTCFTVTC